MDLSNLHTTLRAHQKLSPSILEKYAKLTDLDEVKNTLDKNLSDYKQEVADNYVPEVEDRESDKIYARNGKDRKWVELKETTAASNIEIYYGANDQLQIDDIDELKTLSDHTILELNTKECVLTCNQSQDGYLWICTSQPVKSFKWMGFLWDFVKQKNLIVDTDANKSFFCYRSEEELSAGSQEFTLIF